MRRIYELLVKGNEKAFVGGMLALIGGLGLQVGGVDFLEATVREVVESIALAVATGLGVWLQRNAE